MSRAKLTIRHLQAFINKQYDELPKELGVLLVEVGLLNYTKLTPINYEYWWYEVSDNQKIDKKAYTYDWSDMVETRKLDIAKLIIPFHQLDESLYSFINRILNLEFSCQFNEFEYLFKFYYGKAKQESKQLSIFN